MNLSMQLIPCQRQELVQDLRLEQRLEQRQELQLKLEQKLEQLQELRQELTLSQYQTRAEVFEHIAQWCKEHPKSKKLASLVAHSEPFVYHQIPLALAKESAIDDSVGWFVQLEDKTPFKVVIEDILPEWTLPFVAIHERGEEISRGDHFFASQLEFSAVKNQGLTKQYVQTINSHYPGKFVDLLFSPELDMPFEIKDAILTRMQSGTLDRRESKLQKDYNIARELIKRNPLSAEVMTLAEKYHDYNERIGKLVEEIAVKCQQVFLGKEIPNMILLGRELRDIANRGFAVIPEKYLKVARPHIMLTYQDVFRTLVTNQFARVFGEKDYHFILRGSILEAVGRAKSGQDAVEFVQPMYR